MRFRLRCRGAQFSAAQLPMMPQAYIRGRLPPCFLLYDDYTSVRAHEKIAGHFRRLSDVDGYYAEADASIRWSCFIMPYRNAFAAAPLYDVSSFLAVLKEPIFRISADMSVMMHTAYLRRLTSVYRTVIAKNTYALEGRRQRPRRR